MDKRELLLSYGKIILGSMIASLPMPFLLVPNNVVLGGVGGLTVIVHHFTGWPLGVLLFAFWVVFGVKIFLDFWDFHGDPRGGSHGCHVGLPKEGLLPFLWTPSRKGRAALLTPCLLEMQMEAVTC